jgi:hypothetical protein
MPCCDACAKKFSSNEHKLFVWASCCSVAEWCGILSPERVKCLNELKRPWRVKVPKNLLDMDCLYYSSSYVSLVEDYDIWGTHNARTQQVFNTFFFLSTRGLLIDDVV